MEYCLTWTAPLPSPLELIWDWFHRFFAAVKERKAYQETAVDRDAVNRQAERMLTDYENSILRLAYSYLHNLSDAEEQEDLSFVWEAVKALPTAQREAIHLFYHEGYTTAEIGKMLGRRESTVRSGLRRGGPG